MVNDLSADVVCIQESRLSEKLAQAWSAKMRKRGWNSSLGPAPPLMIRSNSVTEPWAAICSGVAPLAKGLAMDPYDSPVVEVPTHRLVTTKIMLPYTGLQLLTVNLY